MINPSTLCLIAALEKLADRLGTEKSGKSPEGQSLYDQVCSALGATTSMFTIDLSSAIELCREVLPNSRWSIMQWGIEEQGPQKISARVRKPMVILQYNEGNGDSIFCGQVVAFAHTHPLALCRAIVLAKIQILRSNDRR